MKILLTGFDKFGKDSVNPSIEAVKRLPDKIDNAIIIKKEIPTVYKKSVDILLRTIEKEKVDVVLNVGQAGGREGISIEKVGININDFRIPDNEGNVIIDEKIIQTGDDAYFVNMDEMKEFKVTWQDELMEDNGITYRFMKYERQ